MPDDPPADANADAPEPAPASKKRGGKVAATAAAATSLAAPATLAEHLLLYLLQGMQSRDKGVRARSAAVIVRILSKVPDLRYALLVARTWRRVCDRVNASNTIEPQSSSVS